MLWVTAILDTNEEGANDRDDNAGSGDNERQDDAVDADLINLEMLGTDVDNTIIAIEEATRTDLPVWVSISCIDHPTTKALYLGARESANPVSADQFRFGYEPFGPAIERIMATGDTVLSMMHCEIHLGEAEHVIMGEHLDGPLGIYPNAGY